MKLVKTLTVISILLLSLYLHLHNYKEYPQRGASSDEYTYSFMGLSLLTHGVPSSWSNFTPYTKVKHYDLTINHLYFWMVEPYFDHPPLNGILVGGWALLNGENTFEKVQLSTIRLVPIALSVITTFLIFLLGSSQFGYLAGIWAILIYATSTIMVINTRVVFAENLLTPLFLLAIYIYSQIKISMSTKTALLLGLLSGLSFWTKEAGITVFATLIFLFINDKQKFKSIFITTSVMALSILLYIAYGMHFNPQVFWEILTIQSTRLIGPDALHLLMTKPVIVNKVFYDGWYIFGFIALFFTMTDTKRYKLIAIPALIYLLSQVIAINREGESGWYMICLYPFFALSIGALAKEYLPKRNLFITIVSLFVGLSYILNLFEPTFGLSATAYRITFFLALVPPLCTYLWARDRWIKQLNTLWFIMLLCIGAIQTYLYIHPA